MYNRYVPQPDGSFRRDRRMEPSAPPPPPRPEPEPCEEVQETSCPIEPRHCAPQGQSGENRPPRRPAPRPRPENCPRNKQSIGGFFRSLLPGGLDTEDLLIILLLLLMAGDCQEDQNRALLTLALYLFL